MGSLTIQTPLARVLAARIRERGAIPFAEYMRDCLYHLELGYYSRAEARRFADFYTSVDVHPIFGRLIARQLAEMWVVAGRPTPFWVVEAGAGTGKLAKNVLDFAARALQEFYGALRYVVVEQSPARRAGHADALATHAQAGVAFSAAKLPDEIPTGCIFSNELLDAFPVHRVVQEQRELREIYVDVDGDEFCERLGPLSTPQLAEYFSLQSIRLCEGQQAEACLAACEWIQRVGRRLRRGFVLTVDYGHEAAELYNDRHQRGTLLAYQKHQTAENFYGAPGEQDLTAHVNFTALDRWGQRAGLIQTGLVSQGQFLLSLGRANEFADLYDDGQGETQRIRARLLLKNLIYPEGMGEIFRVFVQHIGIQRPQLTGLQPL